MSDLASIAEQSLCILDEVLTDLGFDITDVHPDLAAKYHRLWYDLSEINGQLALKLGAAEELQLEVTDHA